MDERKDSDRNRQGQRNENPGQQVSPQGGQSLADKARNTQGNLGTTQRQWGNRRGLHDLDEGSE
jgi:hypothetical protein